MWGDGCGVREWENELWVMGYVGLREDEGLKVCWMDLWILEMSRDDYRITKWLHQVSFNKLNLHCKKLRELFFQEIW